MLGIPTGKYTILRGTPTTNDYGDEIDTQTAVLSGVSGSVIERSRSNFDPQSSRIVTLRQLTGRFGHGTDIQDGDRVRDESTDVTYLVTSVFHPTAVANKPDVVVDLTLN